MKKFINKKSIVLMVMATALFLYLINNFSVIFIRRIDHGMLNWLIANTNIFMIYVFEIITLFANWQGIVIASLILFALARDKVIAALIFIITSFSFLINETLKQSILRPRPIAMELTDATGYSMPSGHAVAAIVFYGLIILFFARRIKDKKYRILAYVLLTTLISLIGFSRIYLRVHYVSDVIAGFSLGLIILTIVYNLKIGVFDNIKTYIEGEDFE